MTRETRIGLVVGLAFIVLFGVVLSELGTSSEVREARPDRMSRGFYARAPVRRSVQPQSKGEDLPLVARRRTEPQKSDGAEGARRPQGGQQPPPVAGTGRSPQRPAGQPGMLSAPRRPAGGGDRREMTAEEFAAAHRMGGRTDRSRMYVTRRGDNLTAIARKFYRTPSRKAVMKIFNANRNVLQTPDSLGVGVKIVIPN